MMNNLSAYETKETRELLSSGSTVSIMMGIILVIISIKILSEPGVSVMALVRLLGIYLLLKGVIDFFTTFSSETKSKGFTIFGAIIGIIAGIIIISQPLFASVVTTTFLIWTLAIALIVSGAFSMSDSFVSGVLSIIVGFLIFFIPSVALAATLIWLIGFLILFAGIFSIIAGAKLNLEARKIA